MTPAIEGTPTGRGTKRKALEDQRVESPTPPKSPRSADTLALEDLPTLPMLDDLPTQEATWPTALADADVTSPVSNREEMHFRVKGELRAEIARQEARVLASERSKFGAIQQIESVAYQEVES